MGKDVKHSKIIVQFRIDVVLSSGKNDVYPDPLMKKIH